MGYGCGCCSVPLQHSAVHCTPCMHASLLSSPGPIWQPLWLCFRGALPVWQMVIARGPIRSAVATCSCSLLPRHHPCCVPRSQTLARWAVGHCQAVADAVRHMACATLWHAFPTAYIHVCNALQGRASQGLRVQPMTMHACAVGGAASPLQESTSRAPSRSPCGCSVLSFM